MLELKAFTDCELWKGYVAQAAWFWFDASTEEKKLEAGLHRLVARCVLEEIRARGLEEPDPARVYAHARRTFPPDDLHPRGEPGFRYLLDPSPG